MENIWLSGSNLIKHTASLFEELGQYPKENVGIKFTFDNFRLSIGPFLNPVPLLIISTVRTTITISLLVREREFFSERT